MDIVISPIAAKDYYLLYENKMCVSVSSVQFINFKCFCMMTNEKNKDVKKSFLCQQKKWR